MRDTRKWAGISALFLLGLLPAAHAQTGWGEGNKLESTEIVVEKNRVLELPEANRNFQKFLIQPPKLGDRKVTYRFNEYRLPEHYINLPMKVLTIEQEALSKLYGNYVKGAIGNYGTVYAKGYFHNKRSDESSFGAQVGHVSSAHGPIENSGSASSYVKANGDLYFGPLTVGGKLGYERDQNYFYGRKNVAEVEKGTIKQVYNRFGVEGHLNNLTDVKNPFQYEGRVGLNYTNDNYNAKETHLYGRLESNYALSDVSKVVVDLDLAYTNLKDSLSTGRGLFKIRPAYALQMDKLGLVLGATIAYTGDTINDARKFNIYPALEANYQVIQDKLTVFVGAGGDLQRTTLYSLSKENPFLNQNLQIADVNKGLEVYGGFNGSISKTVQFTARVALQNYRNLYFFNNTASDSSRFDLVYDNGVTKVFQFFGQLTFNQSEELRLGLKAENNNYTTTTLRAPYHRPDMKVTAFGTYNLSDKILFNTELYYISSSFGEITRTNGSTWLQETDTIVDLNLKADYLFSPRFSAFLMGNNLLGSKYQRFVNYPSQGISFLGGVTYSF
ncbi:hypothetical protein ACD591_20825 [Rufibacter glacialis]|uniref:TonB-dependent receptor n=1 Tax=Rufibacter glacialis TaxID=1259555 RepID=A0A5M8QHG4_9BACT|nr:hypothetical protein [Rufibacter glacialis]KAA6434206.1 hypothetical protein FOE74_08325 [Rufibacter glacialis]GGK67719.1 hypothetical protein GCM10011405_14620 [Rufibacter glacialis]